MSNPKDQFKDIFGYEPENLKNGLSDTVDLDELLKSIDRELGESKPKSDETVFDFDFYEDIFGDKNNSNVKEYVKPSTKPVKPMPDKKTLSQETRAMPAINRIPEPNPDKSAIDETRVNNDMPIKTYVSPANRKSANQGQHGSKKSSSQTNDSRKDGDNLQKFRLTGIRYFIFVLVVSLVLAYVAWISVNDVFGLNKPEIEATVTIPQKFTMNQVASELKKSGIIEYPWLFKLFGAISHADKKIDPGMYKLTSDLDYHAIVSFMQEGSTDAVVKVTIPEGATMAEIFATLEQKGVCTAAKLQDSAANYNFNYKFLDASTAGEEKRLEGYLFPDTYEFYLDESAPDVLKKFLDNFNSKVTDDMYAQAKKLGYSMTDVIKVASLIEKESASDSESGKIASVVYNRLKSSSFPYLQIDATIQYVLPQRKAKLTDDDLKINSPYNSYTHKGLPPTAIANPGLDSIKAALYPDSTNYYYYALSKSGGHSFFTSSSDFDKFVSSSSYGG